MASKILENITESIKTSEMFLLIADRSAYFANTK